MLQYFMSFIFLSEFTASHGFLHESSSSCNNLAGLESIDSTYAVMTSVAAWLSLPPAVYVIGRVLVPYGEADDEVIKHNDDILHLLQREQREREGKSSLFGVVGKKLSSLFSVDLQLEAVFSWWLAFVSKSLNESIFDRAGQKQKVNGNDYGYERSRYVSE